MGEATVDWLVDGDPSVGWQTRRDLLGQSESQWGPVRHEIASGGWGHRLLALQAPDGKWGGGLYQPKWTSTTYTLLQLRRLGLEPSHDGGVSGARVLLEEADWVDGGVSYWSGRLLAERCVNGMVLSLVSYFDLDDDRIDSIAELLIGSRVDDGGWNCRDYQGDTRHCSFHTTISVLEGLLLWKRRRCSSDADEAITSGQEILLEHGMFRSHTTGEVINGNWTRFSFPPRWHYDILRGLDHLREAGAVPDDRAAEAIDVVLSRQRPDGRWPIGPRYSGEVHFKMETGRNPGRWNTLRALRVMKWWDTVT